jgi:2-hydroxychromene-2-carboxylate isomerase
MEQEHTALSETDQSRLMPPTLGAFDVLIACTSKENPMALAHTGQSQPRTAATQTQTVDFYFDVSCPWAWRTSLWIREVEKVRPLQVTWKFLSLAKINEANDYSRDSHAASHATFPLLARARERFGNDAVDRLYLALGRARHDRKESLADPTVIERALTEAGLDPAWRTDAAAEPGIEERILAEHQDGVERLKAFGVPMLSINGGRGFFGPVITSVPTGEDAGECNFSRQAAVLLTL